MRRRVIDPAGFEAMYRLDIDPWRYATSPFERFKRGVLLAACGFGPFGRALELACGAGVTSRALAPRCLRLLALDSSATAIDAARRRGGTTPGVRYLRATLPEGMPRGPFDLIVASEILYYLPPAALDGLLRRMERALAPGGRLVTLHHLVDFDDAAIRPAAAQARARRLLGRRLTPLFAREAGRFQALAFGRPRRSPGASPGQ